MNPFARVRLALALTVSTALAAPLLPPAAVLHAQDIERPDPAPGYQPQGPAYRSSRSAFRLGQSITIAAGDAVRDLTTVMGSATINGRVDGDAAIIMGGVDVGPGASIGGSLVVVGGVARVAPGAELRGDLVVVGGDLEAPPEFRPGGEYVVIGSNLLGGRLEALVPWLQRGLMWGRPLVPGIGWLWGVVAIFFLLYLVLNLVFEQATRKCAAAANERPLTTLLVGLLTLLLVGPVCLLLAISVVGLVIVPVVICALLLAAIIGRVGAIRWIGMRVMPEEDGGSHLQATRSLAIGFAVLCVLYIVPILGFVTFAVVGVMGFGAATLAFVSGYRTENPRPTPPAGVPEYPPADGTIAEGEATAPPLAYDAPPMPPVPPVAFAPGERVEGGQIAGPAAGVAADASAERAAHAPQISPPPGLPARSALAGFPHGAFLDRLSAFALDSILVIILWNVLPVLRRTDGDGLLLAMLVYHVGFWTWKQTTIGGIICQLRLVRIDGTPLRFVDALVRGLSGIFSVAVVGLGVFWILRDPERQSWHDKIAGTYAVKVPRNWPL
jgi:uncharacterized RDD family membrane protein YckC